LPRRVTDLVIFGRVGESAKCFLDGCACRLIPECSPRTSQQIIINFDGCSPLHVYTITDILYISSVRCVANRLQRQRGATATRDNAPKVGRPPCRPHDYLPDVPSRESAPRLRCGPGNRDRSAWMHRLRKNFDDFATGVDEAPQQQPEDRQLGYNTPMRGSPPRRGRAKPSRRQT